MPAEATKQRCGTTGESEILAAPRWPSTIHEHRTSPQRLFRFHLTLPHSPSLRLTTALPPSSFLIIFSSRRLTSHLTNIGRPSNPHSRCDYLPPPTTHSPRPALITPRRKIDVIPTESSQITASYFRQEASHNIRTILHTSRRCLSFLHHSLHSLHQDLHNSRLNTSQQSRGLRRARLPRKDTRCSQTFRGVCFELGDCMCPISQPCSSTLLSPFETRHSHQQRSPKPHSSTPTRRMKVFIQTVNQLCLGMLPVCRHCSLHRPTCITLR